jgi:ATP-dependent Lhr-like helicase
VVLRGTHLVLVSRRNGSELQFDVEPNDPDLREFLAPLRNMVTRRWNPKSRVSVETINAVPALESPFAKPLLALGFRRDYRTLILAAGYR